MSDDALLEPVNETIKERNARYGLFLRQAAIASDLKEVMRDYIVWQDELAPDQREALDMIAVKIARIINGDPNHADSWHDIAGYAQLVANRLSEKDE